MGKKFNRWLRAAAKAGINVGDLNQASALFTGQTPTPAAPTPPPVQTPVQIKPPSQQNATISSTGAGIGRSKKKIDKRRISDLRIKRGKKSSVARGLGSATGTGMNTPFV